VRRAGVLAVLAGAFVALLAWPAFGHAVVRSSDPAAGEVLQRSPARVLIEFTERPDVQLTFVHVLDRSGTPVERGKAQPVSGNPNAVQVAVPTLPKGVYTVTWRTVSRDDGHVTAGSFSFGIGEAPPAGGAGVGEQPTTPSPTPLAVIGRWAFYWGLAILLGASVAGTVVRREQPRGLRPLLGVAWGLAALGLVGMALAERSAIGVSLGTLLSSEAGQPFLDRGVAVLITGGAVVFAVVRRSWTALPWVGVAAAATMLVHALAGHAAAAEPEWFNVTAQWLHMLGAGVWVGGLVWLLFALPAAPDGERPPLVLRFSRLAAIGLAVVAVTGLIRALDEVGPFADWGRLFTTSYGWALVVKVAIAAVLVALGARNRYRNVPRVASGGSPPGILRRTVMAEVMVAAGVFAATGVLSELPPSATVTAVQNTQATPLVVSGSDFATSVRVRLTVTPGTVGPNRFDARVTDYDTGRPVDATGVKLQFSLPGNPDIGTPELELREGRPGSWTANSTVLSIFGKWSVDVLVEQASGGVEVPLELTPKLPQQDITSQAIPGQPTVYSIALPDGAQLQTYVDPGTQGQNAVHFTFFDQRGNEMRIPDATASAVTPGGSTETLKLDRFSKGHFVANTKLEQGRWLFLIDATTGSGDTVSGYFRERIGG